MRQKSNTPVYNIFFRWVGVLLHVVSFFMVFVSFASMVYYFYFDLSVVKFILSTVLLATSAGLNLLTS